MGGFGRRLGGTTYVNTTVGYDELCLIAPPPAPPPCPPSTPPTSAGLLTAALTQVLDGGTVQTAELMANLRSQLKDAARRSTGCRVDALLGRAMPTFLAAWIAILQVLFIQSIDNIAKLQLKLWNLFIRLLEKYGLLVWYRRYQKARAKVKAAKNKVNKTQAQLEAAEKQASASQEAVEDPGAAVVDRVHDEVDEKIEEVREQVDEKIEAIMQPDLDKLKEEAKRRALKKLATAKETATAFKVINLTVTIVTFLLAVVSTSSWTVNGSRPIQDLYLPCRLLPLVVACLLSPFLLACTPSQPQYAPRKTDALNRLIIENAGSQDASLQAATSSPPTAPGGFYPPGAPSPPAAPVQDHALYEVIMEEVATIEAQATGVCIGGLIYDRHSARLCAAGDINSLTLLTLSLIYMY